MKEIKSSIKFYLNGNIQEISGPVEFVEKKSKNIKCIQIPQKEKTPKFPYNITAILYNFYTDHHLAKMVFLILAIIILKIINPDYIKLNLTRETLEIILQGLVTAMAIFSAIVIAFNSMKQENKLALWRQHFVHYFRYMFVIIVCDLIILILPLKLLNFFQQPYISEIATLAVMDFNIYAFFLIIKATEQYFDESSTN